MERTFRAVREVSVVGMHVEQGFCVRFPATRDGEPLETWEDWSEADFLAEQGSVEPPPRPLSTRGTREARDVLSDAEDGCHLHLHEDEVVRFLAISSRSARLCASSRTARTRTPRRLRLATQQYDLLGLRS